jgi:hypothetical protein
MDINGSDQQARARAEKEKACSGMPFKYFLTGSLFFDQFFVVQGIIGHYLYKISTLGQVRNLVEHQAIIPPGQTKEFIAEGSPGCIDQSDGGRSLLV